MKKSFLFFIVAAFICCSLISANAQAQDSYKGYYYIQSGDEFIKIDECDLDISDVKLNSDKKLEGANEKTLKKKLKYDKTKKEINGHKVDKSILIVTDSPQDPSTEQPSGEGFKGKSGQGDLQNSLIANAYYSCYYGENYRGWFVACSCWCYPCVVIEQSSGNVWIIYC